MISFDVSARDAALITKIVNRADAACRLAGGPKIDRHDVAMSLTACHANGCPLDLEKLLAANDFNLLHDVSGSQSEQWRAGKRLRRAHNRGKQVVILHLGDHDPSGLDMTRDNDERLSLFAAAPGAVEIRRLALNMDQIRRFKPPPNPAKEADSRFADYVKKYGSKSWELDALDPTVIDGLIRDQLNELIDRAAWDDAVMRESQYRDQLEEASNRWDEVTDILFPSQEG